jgi:two-component system, NtrC family, response regulator AtoC
MQSNINIKIFSDIEDLTYIQSSLKRTNVSSLSIARSDPSEISSIENEFVIFQLGVPQSTLLQDLLKFKDKFKGRYIVIFLYKDEILKNALMSLGLLDIFFLPDEIGKLDIVLSEIIKSFFSFQDVLIETEEGKIDISRIIGSGDDSFQKITLVKRAAENSNLNILILGESGTGKELLAKIIHNYYNAAAPFVDINCAAVAEDVLELELFGKEIDEETDGINKKLSLFELAENGSILIDEISSLSSNLQLKLLRVVDRKVIRRIGIEQDIPINARIITTSNRDLSLLVRERKFRQDLYHRLNAITIELTPLRERKQDILTLTEFFVNKFSEQYNIEIKEIEKEVVNYLKEYDWPGNIRELKSVIERAVLLSENKILKCENFKTILTPEIKYKINIEDTTPRNILSLKIPFEEFSLLKLNKLYAKAVLEKLDGNKSKTAKLLGISRPTLDSLLK